MKPQLNCLIETLSRHVAVIPIIGKRNAITAAELARHKAEIMFTLKQRNISCFNFSEEAKLQPLVSEFSSLSFPFTTVPARSEGAVWKGQMMSSSEISVGVRSGAQFSS